MLTLAGPSPVAPSVTEIGIATLADVKAYSQISGTTEDVLLTMLVNGANRAFFLDSCGRFIKVAGSDFDVVLDGPGTRTLYLPQYPIVSVTSIDWVELAGNDTVSTKQTYAATEYQVIKDAARIERVRYGSWPSGDHALRVKYKAGFEDLPPDLVNALCMWVGVQYQRIIGKRMDKISEAAGEDAYTFTIDDAPAAVRRVFDIYRRLELTFG